MNNNTNEGATTVITEMASDLKSLGRERFVAIAGASMIFLSTFTSFVTLTTGAYYYQMNLSNFCWLVWVMAIAILAGWASYQRAGWRKKEMACDRLYVERRRPFSLWALCWFGRLSVVKGRA